jgi:hypothetical protein
MQNLENPEVPNLIGVVKPGTPVVPVTPALTPEETVIEAGPPKLELPDHIITSLDRGREAEELLTIVIHRVEDETLPEYIIAMPEGKPKDAASVAYNTEQAEQDALTNERLEAFFK